MVTRSRSAFFILSLGPILISGGRGRPPLMLCTIFLALLRQESEREWKVISLFQ